LKSIWLCLFYSILLGLSFNKFYKTDFTIIQFKFLWNGTFIQIHLELISKSLAMYFFIYYWVSTSHYYSLWKIKNDPFRDFFCIIFSFNWQWLWKLYSTIPDLVYLTNNWVNTLVNVTLEILVVILQDHSHYTFGCFMNSFTNLIILLWKYLQSFYGLHSLYLQFWAEYILALILLIK